MCGICGWAGAPAHPRRLAEMTRAMAHRGPNDEGFIDSDVVSLGMRRLSIVDRSGGRQPLANEDGSVVVVMNGEIYNHQQLRVGLEADGHQFATGSDAEVLVHLWERDRDGLLAQLRGMFAFALWDRHDDTLLLARDRLGIKPLYFAPLPAGGLVFASELRALLRHPQVPREPDPAAIDDFLALRYVPGPGSLVQGVRRLPAAHRLLWHSGSSSQRRWWTLPAAAPSAISAAAHLEQFGATLDRAIELRTMGEVPVGAYLSGGLDSGTIATGLASRSSTPLETFCVGFGWSGDELADARRAADAIGSNHHEVECRATDLDALRAIVGHLGDPQGDAIVLPSWKLAEAAARSVTVVQSGDGADEILGGYLFHRVLLMAQRYQQLVPARLHRALVRPFATRTPQFLLEALFDYPGRLGSQGRERALAALSLLETTDLNQGWRFLITLFDPAERQRLYLPEFAEAVAAARRDRPAALEIARGSEGPLDRMLAVQLDDWLPDNILHRADALSMAHGLELRVPFLDHEVVEGLQQVPFGLKVGMRRGKILLRHYANSRRLPVGLASRPKKPFYIPLERWGADPVFVRLLQETVSDEVVRRRKLFDPVVVAGLRSRLDAGDFLSFKKLFALMVLEIWFQVFVDRQEVTPRATSAVQGARHAVV